MVERSRHRNQLPSNLPQLQNLVKRDPAAYRDEFMQQYQHYNSLRELLLHSPAHDSPHLSEIVMFIGQVMPCYREELSNYPMELKQLLHTHSSVLHPDIRMTLCRALILLRNKGMIEPNFVLELFFELFSCQDKALRMMLYAHIVSDIKRINARHRNNKVNTKPQRTDALADIYGCLFSPLVPADEDSKFRSEALQNLLFKMLSGSSKVAARMSLDAMIELYRKNIWRDAKTVNVLATACLSPVTKIMSIALRFFLTAEVGAGEVESESSDESDAESRALRDMVLSRQTVKSGRKRERKVAKARAILKKQQKKQKAPTEGRFLALHLIHDPQNFAEKLFRRLERATENFELRLLMMALISRLTGIHQLFLFNLYPFLQRYLQPHQKDVTKVMTYLAQASHELIPPEVLEPVIKAVANSFITERNSSDAIAMGYRLNTVREVCVRCPLVMTRELLADLAGYKTYRDKGVVMAARSLIQLYRTVRPELLQRKDRGKPVEAGTQRTLEYGQLVAEEHVPGMELVDMLSEPDEDPLSDGYESGSDSGWVDVDHSCDEGSSCDESIQEEKVSFQTQFSRQHGCDVKRGTKRKREEERTVSGGREGDVSQQVKRQRLERAVAISQSRFLTDDEFKKLRLKQACVHVQSKRGHSVDAKLCAALEEERGPGEVLSEEAITTIHSKLRRSKEERLATLKAGCEKKTYGHKRAKLNPHSSTTNQQKAKSKSFTMMRQKRSIRAKGKRSFRERQIKLRNSLLKQRNK